MSKVPKIFISCGQYTAAEKKLGEDIQLLVKEITPFEPYFAEFQSSLDGLSNNIFRELYECHGFITVLHHRGIVTPPGDHVRASVWIEQEIAIAAFIEQILRKDLQVIALSEEGVALEGVRKQLLLNPRVFRNNDDALQALRNTLPQWSAVSPHKGNLEIHLDYITKKEEDEEHDYDFVLSIKNTGTEVVDEYYVDLEFPRAALVDYKSPHEIPNRGSQSHKFFRAPLKEQRKSIYPGDQLAVLRFHYFMNNKNFSDNQLMKSTITATLYEKGQAANKVIVNFAKFQKF